MATKNIAVIVPVYNVDKYLQRCIDSLLSQDYSDYEIILVDDGSTDACPHICDLLADNNDKITVIHKKNGGLSDARNAGVSICQSEYIVFVDSDDYVNSRLLSQLWEAKCVYKSDIVCSPLIFEYEGGKSKPLPSFNPVVVGSQEAQAYTLRSKYCGVSACAKLFPKRVLEKYPYPVGKLNEDLHTTYWHLSDVNKIAFVPQANYHYVQRMNSISYFDINFSTAIESINVCRDFINISDSESVKYAAANRIFKLVSEVCKIKGDIQKKERIRIQSILREYWKLIDKDPDISVNEKLKCWLLSYNAPSFHSYRVLQAANRRRFI